MHNDDIPIPGLRTLRLDIVSIDNDARSIVLAINGNRYEYFFNDGFPLVVEELHKKLRYNRGQALSWIKRRANSYKKVLA